MHNRKLDKYYSMLVFPLVMQEFFVMATVFLKIHLG